MSYILEALKKAQAERQLGSAPTIHAPAAHSAPEPADRRKPLVIGAAAGVLLVAGAAIVWRQQAAVPAPSTVAQAPASAVAPHPAPATPAPARVAPVPVEAAAAPAGPVVALVGTPDKPEPPAAKPVKPAEPAPRKAEPAAAPAPSRATVPPARVAGADKPAPAVAAAATPSPDDSLPTVNGLPDAVRRDVPKVAFGGYMYSPNPADRLVLVDKSLRHEGEEVAPGLLLEKLLPRGAVLNFRGYRYRVPF